MWQLYHTPIVKLTNLCGERVPGVWEPVVLEDDLGVGDEPIFLSACRLI